MLKKTILAVAVLALAAGSAGAVEVYDIDKTHSEVGFQVRHIVTKVRGRFNDFSGTVKFDREKPEKSNVEFTVKAESVDTNLADRDKHLRAEDFFHVEKYPEISFKSKKVEVAGPNNYNVHGTLTIRGVSKEVVLPVEFLGSFEDPWGNVRAGFETSTVVNRQDFGMDWNLPLNAGGFILGDEITIDINLEAIQEKAKDSEASK